MKISKKLILSIAILAQFYALNGQIGGRYVYEFLGSPQSARLTALGGSLITVADEDVSLAAANPALLSNKTDNQITFNHNFVFAGIGNGYLGYGHKIDKWDINTHIGISYLSMGDFTSADIFGNDTGTFSGRETALTVGASKKVNERITLGANVKTIFGSLEAYNSFGMGLDLGLLYQKPESRRSFAMVIKNIGGEISSYGNEAGQIPLDVQIAFSQKLEHLPFRFTIVAHQLQKWGVRYDDPDQIERQGIFGEEIDEPSKFNTELDNFFRHFIFNGEFLLGKNQGFKLRVGYNHLRRKELSLSNFKSLAGFSGGFGIRIKGFQLDYGLGYYHLAGAANHLSISTDLGRFFKKI